MDAQFPVRPLRVYLDVTNRCQLACRHCCTDSGQPLEDELSTSELLDVVDQVRCLGGPKLVISGREPLMRPDLAALLQHAVRQRPRVTLLTNGLLIGEAFGRRLAAWGVRVKVSLDGAAAARRDYLGGRGPSVRPWPRCAGWRQPGPGSSRCTSRSIAGTSTSWRRCRGPWGCPAWWSASGQVQAARRVIRILSA